MSRRPTGKYSCVAAGSFKKPKTEAIKRLVNKVDSGVPGTNPSAL